MAQRREKLGRAPIVEAMIDFRVEPGPLALADLNRAIPMLASEYPAHTVLRSLVGTFDTNTESMNHQSSQIGLMFRSADGRNVTQWKLDGRLHV